MDPVTLGEIARNLAALSDRIDSRFAEVSGRMDDMGRGFVRAEVYAADKRNHDMRVELIESTQQGRLREVHKELAGRVDALEVRHSDLADGIRWFRRAVVVAVPGFVSSALAFYDAFFA